MCNVSGKTGNRVVCMCDDCQAFAHYLGRAEDILDASGGTDLFQVTPSQLTIADGKEHIRCVRLTDKGLLRWYTECCKTPIANCLPSARVPFVGVPHVFMDHAGDVQAREELLGPVLAAVHGRFAIGGLPPGAHRIASVGIVFRFLSLLLRGWFKGLHKPSPLFDAVSGKPVVTPTVLALAERAQLRVHCGPK